LAKAATEAESIANGAEIESLTFPLTILCGSNNKMEVSTTVV